MASALNKLPHRMLILHIYNLPPCSNVFPPRGWNGLDFAGTAGTCGLAACWNRYPDPISNAYILEKHQLLSYRQHVRILNRVKSASSVGWKPTRIGSHGLLNTVYPYDR
ncbi:hypothetical protein I7I50_11506 [Histoplasma capsulatum G186AR]|uniref:Uncharacterized protein n=1 Tax=Ajellomyces capsulatus TaxID=5037 RepID=A0A8H8D734_AJECA|nr:hypothetical protein I7I52_02743 [Histoplasma capsulatum]QSS70013.1 hypothetical protein I7I50_11506 [Histoplasma capsulatum G186AR]